jgi:hypothetical protein
MQFDEIHIWKTSLLWQETKINLAWEMLSDAEKQRAKQFIKKIDQQKFIAARASLRQLLRD